MSDTKREANSAVVRVVFKPKWTLLGTRAPLCTGRDERCWRRECDTSLRVNVAARLLRAYPQAPCAPIPSSGLISVFVF